MRNFRELLVWQKGMEVVVAVYQLQMLTEEQKMLNSFISNVRERTKKNYTKVP